MIRFKLLLILLCCSVVAASYGQSRRSKKKSPRSAPTNQPTTRDPGPFPQKEYAPKPSRKGAQGPTYESEEKYYERMAQLEKTRRKNEVAMSKPQYSDPMYFGHKRPPKKRKPGKMKYCRECGIRH
jgi:hypothetical protein